jgi:hypothetical protein
MRGNARQDQECESQNTKLAAIPISQMLLWLATEYKLIPSASVPATVVMLNKTFLSHGGGLGWPAGRLTHDSVPPSVECEQVNPGLAVSDIATALEFYTRKLGFVTAFTWGDPPTFAPFIFFSLRVFSQS